MRRLAIVMLFGLLLQILRLCADWVLDQLHAPGWTYWVTIGVMFFVWFTAGNWMYYRLGQPKPKHDNAKTAE